MTGFSTMSIIFGVIFALVGLALAVLLGLALYPDKKHIERLRRENLRKWLGRRKTLKIQT